MFKRLSVAAAVVAGALGSASAAHAVVISDTKVLLAPTTEHGANYAITAIQSPDHPDPTTLWFSKVDSANKSTLTPITWNVDQEADYYLAQAGSVVSAQTLASGQFTPLFTLDRAYSIDVSRPGDFYLAVATTGPGLPPGAAFAERNVWGWVHLRNDASGLSVLGSAMAYGEGGIIVGTTTPVPEPGTAALMLLGLAAGGWATRRRLQTASGTR